MKFIFCLFATVLTIYQSQICMAAQQSDQSSDLAHEVFQMSKSLDELNQILRSQQSKIDEFQKLQTAISYLSFRSRSIEMLQYELRFKKERRDGTEKAIERTQAELEEQESQKTLLTNGPKATPNKALSPELRLERLRDSLERSNTEIITLENEIQFAKSELTSFESYVQERLDLIH